MIGKNLGCFYRKSRTFAMALVLTAASGYPQEASHKAASMADRAFLDALTELQAQVRDLNAVLVAERAEQARSREEIQALRRELREARSQLDSMERHLEGYRAQPATPAGASVSAPNPEGARNALEGPMGERLAKLKEDQQMVGAKIDEQYQTKVESASKYRVRLSGIVLLNVFGNRGTVDNQDVPNVALSRGVLDSGGDFGATIRQSELGLEVFGPKVAGARTSGGVQFDFFGGFPDSLDGVTAGLVRLRTAQVRLDWSHSSIVAGQEAPFFSPLSPTSVASLGVPAFAYAGNLWTWTPQIRVERRFDFSDRSGLLFAVGILDPLSGQPPQDEYTRSPEAGERTRKPASAARIAWTHNLLALPMTLGVGGYYSPQNWGFERRVDAWAGTVDWSVPLSRWFALTGEFYRGRALGGLGGGVGRSVLQDGLLTDPATSVVGLNTIGGWTQLKFRPTEKIEFNTAFGEDNPLAADFSQISANQSYLFPSVARNQNAMVNVIYRPRSNLLFSLEYRRLHTFEINRSKDSANHINLGVGMLF